jgi:hypothetical protein
MTSTASTAARSTDLTAGSLRANGAITQRIRQIDEDLPRRGVKTARYGPISRMTPKRGNK